MPTRPFETQLSIPIQTYDIDFAGIVSNIVYIRWLEDLRIKMIEAAWPIQLQFANNVVPILAETQIRYQRSLTLQDNVRGYMWMSHLKKLKWTVSAEFCTAEQTVATATQSGCFIDLKNQKPILVPQHILNQYQQLLTQE